MKNHQVLIAVVVGPAVVDGIGGIALVAAYPFAVVIGKCRCAAVNIDATNVYRIGFGGVMRDT